MITPGTILRPSDSRHALVAFKDIGIQTVANRFLLPSGGAISRPQLSVCVLYYHCFDIVYHVYIYLN